VPAYIVLRAALTGALMGMLAVAARAETNEGRSVETAVLIRSDSGSLGGIAREAEWLREHYPGWRRTRQALLSRNGRRYDRIDIESPTGERVSVFFDITAAFGLP
jgi:hypothetical protein